MSASRKPCRTGQPSIKYRVNPAEGAFFEIRELVPEEYAPSLPDNNRKTRIKSDAKQPQKLSTAEFISSLNQIWNSASFLAIPQQQTNHERACCVSQKEDMLVNLGLGENGTRSISAGSKLFCIDLTKARQLPSVMKPNFGFVKITKKMSKIDSSIGNINHSFYQGLLCCGSDFSNESWKGNGLATVGFSSEVGNIYKWMRKMIPPAGLHHFANVPEIVNKKIGGYYIATSSGVGNCISSYRTSPIDNLPIENAEPCSHHIKSKDLSSSHDTRLVFNTRGISSLCSDYFLTDVQETMADCSVLRTLDSDLRADYHIDSLASHFSTYKERQLLNNGNEYLDNQRKQPEPFSRDDSKTESHSAVSEKPQYALAKHEHAFAGAFAGIFVSLCLHPIDTVKTVIQSCNAEQKSIFCIGRSIISERGSIGLYRGIASNIASSAPISAFYTLSYESVKGASLPLLTKEYHSLAHCMAGGCASVATSFIFTPSERIKQQMQVGVHYQNCWKALVETIKKGGLPSLYTGWGAVLCRNIPHSIIKFYTYESLKQVMLISSQSPVQPNTLQTLVCGALAGSTAAFFTTPFDVVKTRLLTQIPGSLSRYNNVYNALQDIWMHEGLKGVYRGLVPRLVMYTTQGALFFASYEFFKQLLCSEAPRLTTNRQEKENEDYSSLKLPSPTSTTRTPSSPPSRLHG
ncbi:Mitochondrial substrate carrier family protein, putative isoform 6 [Hibiscus syriacus]|uniref:Mitochondrial substrate carrier family protein, putative isoform 6 n=2 Tax=Hibiscus syriacus TaxID=106335 RepID=A0A6A2XQ84_HIBSY|nr:Mitochondrial substrate carrier family protein, putative isoform 6 [Hibiscus syriacus]